LLEPDCINSLDYFKPLPQGDPEEQILASREHFDGLRRLTQAVENYHSEYSQLAFDLASDAVIDTGSLSGYFPIHNSEYWAEAVEAEAEASKRRTDYDRILDWREAIGELRSPSESAGPEGELEVSKIFTNFHVGEPMFGLDHSKRRGGLIIGHRLESVKTLHRQLREWPEHIDKTKSGTRPDSPVEQRFWSYG
jgi:hypothetical protein